MSTWTVKVDFGTGFQDITTDVDKIKRTRRLHKDLTSAVDSCQFVVTEHDTAVKLQATTGDVPCEVDKDGSAWFRGVIRPSHSRSYGANLKRMQIEAVDYGYTLQRQIVSEFSLFNVQVSDPNDTSNSFLHSLFTAAGINASAQDFAEITETIEAITVVEDDDMTYWDLLNEVLFEYGYVVYQSPGGVWDVFDLFPTSITSTAITDTNLDQELKEQRRENRYGKVRVKLHPVVTRTNVIVWSDTTNQDAVNKCNIAISAGGYYPDNCNTSASYARYEMDDYEIIKVENAVISSEWSGVTQETFTPLAKKAQICFSSSGGGTITKLDIVGDATMRDKTNTTIVTRTLTSGQKTDEYEATYITTQTQAERLASGLIEWYSDSQFLYTAHAETAYGLGDYLDYTSSLAGIDAEMRVIEEREDQYGYRRINMEPVEPVTFSSDDTESESSPPGTQPDEQKERNPIQSPTYEELQEGYDSGGGTTTPDKLTLSADSYVYTISLTWNRQLDLTNLQQYEVQVSDDQTDWYSLQFDGTDWKDTLDATTVTTDTYILHTEIPPTGTDAEPAGRTLYYRLRQRTKDDTVSAWSDVASATTRPTEEKDLKVGSVTADKVDTAFLNAVIAQITEQLEVVQDGVVGKISDSFRVLITGTKVALQADEGGVWKDRITIGGNPGTILPDMIRSQGLAKIGSDLRGLDIGDASPSGSEWYQFENEYTSNDGADPWNVKENLTFTPNAKFGAASLTSEGGLGRLIDNDGKIGLDFSNDFSLTAWTYADALPEDETDILRLRANDGAQGTRFQFTGTALTLSGVDNPAITALSDDLIAYVDAGNQQLRTYKWDGSSWSQVGNSYSLTADPSSEFDIEAISSTDIAYCDDAWGNFGRFHWDGTDWSQVGSFVFAFLDGNPAIAKLTSDTVALTGSSPDSIKTYQWDGTKWSQVGNTFTPGDAFQPSISRLSSDTIAFANAWLDELKTYKWDGTDWSQVGSTYSFENDLANVSIATLSPNIIAATDQNRKNLYVYIWDGSTWSKYDDDGNPAGLPSFPVLAGLGAGRLAWVDENEMELRMYSRPMIRVSHDGSGNLVMNWSGGGASQASQGTVSAGWLYYSLHFDTSADTIQLVINGSALTAQDVSGDSSLSRTIFPELLLPDNTYRYDDLLVMESSLLSTSDSVDHYGSGFPWAKYDYNDDLFLVPKSGGKVTVLGGFELSEATGEHDTGWVQCSDWTAQKLGDTVGGNITHGLNQSLENLDVRLFIRNDTEWGGAIYEASQSQGANSDNLGWQPHYIDDDTIQIYTASSGIGRLQDSGGNVNALDTETADYRVLVRVAKPVQGPRGPIGTEGPQGDRGPEGEKGDPPEHEWNGTKLRFENPDGTWGKSVNTSGVSGDLSIDPMLAGLTGWQSYYDANNPDMDLGSVTLVGDFRDEYTESVMSLALGSSTIDLGGV